MQDGESPIKDKLTVVGIMVTAFVVPMGAWLQGII